jgi:pilus assembly protein CpaE
MLSERGGPVADAEELGRILWFVALDDDVSWLDRLNEMFAGRDDVRMAGGTCLVREVPRLAVDNGADLLLVADQFAGHSGMAAAGALARQLPAVRVYLMASSPTATLWEEARRRGVAGVLPKPFAAEDLVRRLRDDLDAERRAKQALAPPSAPLPPSVSAADAPRAIAVFSFKGGVGKSLIAANLAVAAAAPSCPQRRQVVFVDGEEGAGTAPTLLGATGRPTLLDWAEYEGERQVDPGIALQRLAQLRCGLHCLFAPGSLDQAVSGALMDTVLATLRGMFALVVVDCAPQVTESVLAAIRQCTVLLLVVEPTLDCLDKVRRGLGALRGAGVGLGKAHVLINQGRPGAGEYAPVEVREALGLPVLGRIPFDAGVRRAVNRRQPLALAAARGPFMDSLLRAVAGVLPGVRPEPGLPRWVPRR